MKNTNGLLTIKNLVKHFDISGGLLDQLAIENRRIIRRRTMVKALNDVSLSIMPRETLGVVGESGCGKSTLARAVLGLYPPTSGEIYYQDNRIDNITPQKMLPYRKKMQMIFQDPYASLNPRMAVKRTLEEPFIFHNKSITSRQVEDKVAEVMQQVGVEPSWATRYPHEFSGGQRQRISIARALMVDPEFIVADEPVSDGGSGKTRVDLSVHYPRFICCGTHQQPGGGHVFRHYMRIGPNEGDIRIPATPIYASPAQRHSGTRPPKT
jgi:peptide/nickel transport system ATP-binding protein